MARRTTWLIDMGDGTWAVSCLACRIALYRGGKAGAERAARHHYCEPVLPSAAGAGRRRPEPSPLGGRPDPGPPVDRRAAHRQPPQPLEGAPS